MGYARLVTSGARADREEVISSELTSVVTILQNRPISQTHADSLSAGGVVRPRRVSINARRFIREVVGTGAE